MMELKSYEEVTANQMKDILEGLGIETKETGKKEIYEVYEKAVKEINSKKETPKQEETSVEKTEEKVETPKAPKRARIIEPNEMIPVRSVTRNGLTYISPKTGMKITWSRYGDVDYMEFSEIMTMRAQNRAFLEKPYIVIDDEDVVIKLGLNSIYDSMLTENQIENFFNLSVAEMGKELDSMPERNLRKISEVAVSKIGKDLNDFRKINLLEKKLNIGLDYLIRD